MRLAPILPIADRRLDATGFGVECTARPNKEAPHRAIRRLTLSRNSFHSLASSNALTIDSSSAMRLEARPWLVLRGREVCAVGEGVEIGIGVSDYSSGDADYRRMTGTERTTTLPAPTFT